MSKKQDAQRKIENRGLEAYIIRRAVVLSLLFMAAFMGGMNLLIWALWHWR